MKTLYKVFSTAILAMSLSLFVVAPHTTHAAITPEDIQGQRLVVMSELIDVLHEHVKLLQMAYLNQLEAEVAALQARVEARVN